MIAGDNQDMGALVRGQHDKAVEVAYRSRFGNEPDHADKVSGVIFSRDELRRAIAAFLRAWEPSDDAHEYMFGFNEDADMHGPLKNAAKQTADELEQP